MERMKKGGKKDRNKELNT